MKQPENIDYFMITDYYHYVLNICVYLYSLHRHLHTDLVIKLIETEVWFTLDVELLWAISILCKDKEEEKKKIHRDWLKDIKISLIIVFFFLFYI